MIDEQVKPLREQVKRLETEQAEHERIQRDLERAFQLAENARSQADA